MTIAANVGPSPFMAPAPWIYHGRYQHAAHGHFHGAGAMKITDLSDGVVYHKVIYHDIESGTTRRQYHAMPGDFQARVSAKCNVLSGYFPHGKFGELSVIDESCYSTPMT